MFTSNYSTFYVGLLAVFPNLDDCITLQRACIGMCGRHGCLFFCKSVACHGARWGHFRGVRLSSKDGKNDRNANEIAETE